MKTFILREERHANALWAYLKLWREIAGAGRPLVVEVKEEKSKRSRDQEKRHWARMRYLSEFFQPDDVKRSADEWHGLFCLEFIGKREKLDGTGEGYISSTALNTAEYAIFETRIDEWVARFEFYIPDNCEEY